MIIDDFLIRHPPLLYDRQTIDFVGHQSRAARRFVFDAAASELVGKFAWQCPDLVSAHRQFALPPYQATYIEVDSKAFFKEFPASVDASDDRLSWLFVGQEMYEFSERLTNKGADAALTPFKLKIVPPGQAAGPDTMTVPLIDGRELKLGFDFKMALLMGSAFPHSAPEIVDEVSVHWLGKTTPRRREFNDWVEFFAYWQGTWRNALAALLWLNQPARLRMDLVGPSRHISRGKLRTYLSHHVVTIDLNKKYRTVRKAFLDGAERTPPRRHEVRGSFHHHGGQLHGCGHDWPTIPDMEGIWQCKRCGRRRWWVRDHMRGDATRGFVHKEYETTVTPNVVTPGKENP
jgi:hypothetical protein